VAGCGSAGEGPHHSRRGYSGVAAGTRIGRGPAGCTPTSRGRSASAERPGIATAIDEIRAEPEGPPKLTSREREVLAHIVAGRTYGEIARELVLSEKTVSVHVSNMLHKTGAANRVELAQLARRLAAEAN
jgi:DNA-binding NarL/FixJ family response regulator